MATAAFSFPERNESGVTLHLQTAETEDAAELIAATAGKTTSLAWRSGSPQRKKRIFSIPCCLTFGFPICVGCTGDGDTAEKRSR